MNNITFAAFAAGHGCADPEKIQPGHIHRFGKNKAQWCLLFHDCAAGVVGDWRTGDQYTWFASRDSALSRQEIFEARRKVEQAREQRDCEIRQGQIKAAAECMSRLASGSQPPPRFPYLVDKQMEQFAGLFQFSNNALMAPLETAEGLVNIQYIFADGRKRFHPGAQVTGAYFVAQVPEHHHSRLIIAEGIATACTLALDEPTAISIAAMNCGNLLPVAQTIRKNHPRDRIIIAGDNDRFTKGNPGKTKAIEAARAIGAEIAIPEFPPGVAGTDYNDLFVAGVFA